MKPKTKEKIGTAIAVAAVIVLAIISGTIDKSLEQSQLNKEPVTICNSYTNTCFTR